LLESRSNRERKFPAICLTITAIEIRFFVDGREEFFVAHLLDRALGELLIVAEG
jgi:hypothetical protein